MAGNISTGWAAGAVKRPVNSDLQESIHKLELRNDTFAHHRQTLASLGSEVVYAKRLSNGPFAGCSYALVRLSGAIESAFGFTREVLVFYSPHPDLQIRTYEFAKSLRNNLNREITQDYVFMHSPDPRAKVKLDDWSKSDCIAIPLLEDFSDHPEGFIALLRSYIYTRDLFYETAPVRGQGFFGRRMLLQSLRDDINYRRVSGVFGLRKAGKTSVLYELSDEISSATCIPILMDLETLPSPPEDPTPDLLTQLRSKLLEELRSKNMRSKEITEIPTNPSILQLKTAFSTVLKKLSTKGVKVVLMLDEIEYLTPSDRIDVSEGPLPQIAQLLGVFRSWVQENDNFTFILSGLTNAIVESGRLYGRPNPLYSWAKSYYIKPFERSEADNLSKTLCAKMGIEITSEALEALHEASGGHAYLYRNLASDVIGTLPLVEADRKIKSATVLHALSAWRRSVAPNVKEMIDHVRRYYPTEHFLLELINSIPEDFDALAAEEPQAINHLISLGLVETDGHTYRTNVLLELV